MKLKSSTAVLLVLCALATASCGKGDPQKPTDTIDTVTTADVVTEEGRPNHGLDLETLDFSGMSFHMLAGEWQGYNYYFFSDGEGGNTMDDAIWRRECAVENALGVEITYEYYTDNIAYVAPHIKRVVNAGEDAYDQIFLHCIYAVADLAADNCFYNLDDLPNIDMEAEWWNKTQMDTLRLGENTYFAINDFMIPCPYVITFNREMIANMDLWDPYQLVYDGKWTLDRFASLAKEVSDDTNGDGDYTIEDQYGITVHESSKYASFLIGSHQPIAARNDTDGRIELTLNTPKTQTIIEVFKDLMDHNAIWTKGGLNQPPETTLTMDSGRVLFYLDSLAGIEILRDCEVEYGILPYPKYDEEQEQYASLDWGGLSAVLTTITEPEMVGAVMELLAWESANDVIPAYYDRTLQGKLARDPDAVKMLDLMFDTITYDVGMNYFGFSSGVTDYMFCISGLAINGRSTDFASYYRKLEGAAQRTIDQLYKQLEANED